MDGPNNELQPPRLDHSSDEEITSKEVNTPAAITNGEVADQTLAFNPGWRFYAAFGSLAVITLAAALDSSSLSVALAIMAEKLHGSGIETYWAGTSFLLSSTVFQPSFAAFSQIFGRKPLVFVALTLFTIGAIVCALAKNFMQLLVGRSIQGVGGGGIIALTEIIITDMVPLKERGKWFGFISAMWAIGSVTGPIIGGSFSQHGQCSSNLFTIRS